MKEAVIYLRVSTDKQEELNQLPVCEALAKELGITEWDVIQEKMSAYKNPDRESLRKLEAYKHVIVSAYDRLHRNREAFVNLMALFAYNGIKIHTAQERWMEALYKIPAPFDKIITDMMIQFVGWMAEEESKKRSSRVKMAYERDKDTVKWGRPGKEVDMARLETCLSAGSLRKISNAYNEGLSKDLRISYATVKKITEKIHEGKTIENPCEEKEAVVRRPLVRPEEAYGFQDKEEEVRG